jgi:dGTPase
MADVGGYSHNQFALTIVQQLEQRYPQFTGLNLSAEMLGGQDTRAHKAEAAVGRAPLLEVQIVDAADSIAYDAHDVDDALQMGLLSIEQLSQLAIIRRALDRAEQKAGDTWHQSRNGDSMRQLLVHELIDLQVGDLLEVSLDQLHTQQGRSADDICDAGIRVSHTDEVAAEREELEAFLFDAVYRHPRLLPVRDSAANRLRTLFEVLNESPERLPLRFRRRLEGRPRAAVVGEYLAGMTDQFCDEQFASLQSSGVGPLADW